MKRNCFIIFLMIGLWLLLPTSKLNAQVFDYHREEGPSQSWNGIPYYDARMLGAGGVSFMASPSFAVVANPALIPRDMKLFGGISYQGLSYEAFQYWGINQGVMPQPDNLQDRDDRISGFSIAIPFKGIRFAAGYNMGNLMQLPYFMYISDSGNYHGTFIGVEHHLFGALAFSFGEKLDIGLKVDYMWGDRNITISEGWFDYSMRFDHVEEHKLKCITPTLGLTYKVTPNWTLGAVVEYPLKGTADRTISRSVIGPEVDEQISNLTSSDKLYRPPRFSFGSSYNLFPGVILAAEATYVMWSDYEYEYYSEIIPREMKNSLILAVGAEYGEMGKRVGYNIRAGYRMDPQPIKDPGITFHGITGGLTLRVNNVFFDVGGIIAFGKAGDINYNYAAFTGSFRFFIGKGGAPTGGTK